ncbi:tripartite tricarboxylate transporter permease [Fusibacter bizertensis]|uniref:Tripartite tricarboxylate transporter permease n=1 Tax=Fusibacter bizertensis TaxID=1488331 RepID=A0ABT6NCD8_9FIRM|nr:tripartite tricarboxylate transporter permease [Fusibacter bizertensis]MDH8678079.1 tripartite tricarboxylate transporter permease [Fusibacter bizertensis]
MENLASFISAFIDLLSINVILLMLGSTALGVIIGALPGLTATMGIALLTGLTYNVPLEYTFTILMGVYVGGIYGGSISAILLNIPGTASAAATALDGHQLALQGKAETAIKVTRLASIIGTLIGVLALALLAPPLTKIALQFQSTEFFVLALFGVLICGSIAAEDLSIKGWIGGLIGLSIAFVKIDNIEGVARFTFGNPNLLSGISVIPAMIGFYAIPEVIKAFSNDDPLEVTEAKDISTEKVNVLMTVIKKFRVIVQSALIGLGLGALPGVGEDVAAWVSYDTAKKTSKEKEKYGKGSYEGAIAPEVGNNAAIGGATIPLLTLGVPGSPPAAVLLGALTLHGIRPGPMINIESPGFISQIAALILLAVVALWVVGVILAKPMTKILKVPKVYLMPIVAALSVIGSFAIGLSMFDLTMVFIFGVLGFFLSKMAYSPAPIVLGLILGGMIDETFRRSLIAHNGSFSSFFTRPIALIFLILIVLTIAKQIFDNRKQVKSKV